MVRSLTRLANSVLLPTFAVVEHRLPRVFAASTAYLTFRYHYSD